MGLTVKRVARLTKPGRYLDRDGLYLKVLCETNRSWLLNASLGDQEAPTVRGTVKNEEEATFR